MWPRGFDEQNQLFVDIKTRQSTTSFLRSVFTEILYNLGQCSKVGEGQSVIFTPFTAQMGGAAQFTCL